MIPSKISKDTKIVPKNKEDDSGLIETLYLESTQQTLQEIMDGINTPIEEFLSEDEIEW